MVNAMGRRVSWCPLLALLILSGSAGCSVLHGKPDQLLQSSTDPAASRIVVVELRDGEDKPEYLRAPWTETMLVQDALKGSGAIQRFRRMNVVLVRETPNGQTLRLPVQYDVAKRRVVETNNYALHAGDRLEVTRDTRTTLDRMLESALEPLRVVTVPRGH